jgi:hypothetical protein
MFGGKKNKIQVQSVEEYLKGSDAGDENGADDGSLPLMDTKKTKPARQGAKMKPFIVQSIVGIVVLALLLTALSQISVLKSEVADLQQRKDSESQALKTQVSDLSTKLGKAYSVLGEMTDRLSSLERQLDAERSQRLKAVAVAKKPVPSAEKKKVAKPRG